MTKPHVLQIDGSQGEGGGQVLRTSLSLSAITGRPFRLINVRANRSKPGLRPQHLTAVHAAAAICQAQLQGDKLNSATLEFHPQSTPQSDSYVFDVRDANPHGSAGAVTLILQTIMWPLLFADAPSQVTLRGGTHVPFSPPYHYLAEVAQPAFAQLGAHVQLNLTAWGWNPGGGGEITAVISPISHLQTTSFVHTPFDQVQGIAAAINLPAHIPNRMAHHTHQLLQDRGLSAHIQEIHTHGAAPGAGLMLWVPQGGFTCLGRKGFPADKVAETAVAQLVAFMDNTAAVDYYLADQLLLPLALAQGTTTYTTNTLTQHTLTNAQLLRQWLDVDIHIKGTLGQVAEITVKGIGLGGG